VFSGLKITPGTLNLRLHYLLRGAVAVTTHLLVQEIRVWHQDKIALARVELF
jgi:hypothetical protein